MKKIYSVFRVYALASKEYGILGLGGIILFGIAVALIEVIRPYLYKYIIDGLETQTISPIFAVKLFIGLAILYNIFYRSSDYTVSLFQTKMFPKLFNSAVKNVMGHSSGFFAGTFAGKLIAKVRRYAFSFETLYDELIYRLLIIVVYVTGLTCVAFATHTILGIIITSFILIMCLFSTFFFSKKIAYDEEVAKAESGITGSLSDIISNIQTILFFGKRKQEFESFKKVTAKYGQLLYSSWNYGNKVRILKSLLVVSFEATMIYSLTYYYLRGEITIGTVSLFFGYMVSLSNTMWSLDESLKKISKAIGDAIEMLEVFDHPFEIVDIATEEYPVSFEKPIIRIENVSFSYGIGKEVFSNLNITIAAGEKVGICGTTGGGKSTLVNLMLRKMDTTQGNIYIDNYSIRDHFPQDVLKTHIAYVPQMIEIFNRSIEENIRFAHLEATDEEVIAAAQRVKIHDFIMTLPDGYKTVVGEKGTKLSGGQCQRIGIARAILKNAPILILDEATSALDVITESEILEILNKEFESKTVIVIAHRLSTIRTLDRILVLDQGTVAEDGTHRELLEKQGLYFDFITAQAEGQNTLKSDLIHNE